MRTASLCIRLYALAVVGLITAGCGSPGSIESEVQTKAGSTRPTPSTSENVATGSSGSLGSLGSVGSQTEIKISAGPPLPEFRSEIGQWLQQQRDLVRPSIDCTLEGFSQHLREDRERVMGGAAPELKNQFRAVYAVESFECLPCMSLFDAGAILSGPEVDQTPMTPAVEVASTLWPAIVTAEPQMGLDQAATAEVSKAYDCKAQYDYAERLRMTPEGQELSGVAPQPQIAPHDDPELIGEEGVETP